MVLPLYTVTSLVQATIISKVLPWPTTTFPAFTLDSLQSICNAAAGRVSQIVSVKASRHFILNKIQSPNNGVNLGLNGINDSLLEPFASPAAVSSASPQVFLTLDKFPPSVFTMAVSSAWSVSPQTSTWLILSPPSSLYLSNVIFSPLTTLFKLQLAYTPHLSSLNLPHLDLLLFIAIITF